MRITFQIAPNGHQAKYSTNSNPLLQTKRSLLQAQPTLTHVTNVLDHCQRDERNSVLETIQVMRPQYLRFPFRCIIAAVVLAACQTAAAPPEQKDGGLLSGTNLLRIQIRIPPEGIQSLRESRRPSRAKVSATVTEGAKSYSNVSVHLKGRGTFQPIDERPSFTLNFGKGAASFYGLEKLSLNNSAQDPTCLQEKLARELFQAAGVPAARADHALVTLNGRELGVYVLTEGYNKDFLRRHFKSADGPFYDGGLFTDLDRNLEIVSGAPQEYSGLQRVVLASRETDPELRFRALDKALDLDRFISLIAMETILCHWDGYAMRRTNYRAYYDPETKKITILPQGMDRVLGNFRRNLDLPLIPPMVGLAARSLLGTAEGRRRYIERVGTLFTNLFQPETLCRRVRQMDREIAGALNDSGKRWQTHPENLNQVVSSGSHLQDVQDLCKRIEIRAAHLREQFAELEKNSTPPPLLEFDESGSALLSSWTARAAYLEPKARVEKMADHSLRLVNRGIYAALGYRLSLPGGRYRLTGRVKTAVLDGAESNGRTPRIMVRHFESPFTQESQPLAWQEVTFPFVVPAGPAPAIIDLLCEIRGKGEMQINSFRLEKEARFD